MNNKLSISITFMSIFFSCGAYSSMETIKSTKCSVYGHPEIAMSYDSKFQISEDVKIILDSFESDVAKGVEYKAGQTLKLGFMLNEFAKFDDSTIQVMEPDMVSMPIKYVPGVSNTIMYLREQRFVVDSFAPKQEIDFPLIVNAMYVHKNYKTMEQVILKRAEGKDRVTGWWLFPPTGFGDKSNYIGVTIYELALHRPELIKFLAMPVGSLMLIDGSNLLEAKSGNNKLTVIPESFLDSMN